MQAVEQLNIKADNWRELITDKPFSRSDIITIQDPQNLDKFNISSFYHIKNKVRVVDGEFDRATEFCSTTVLVIKKKKHYS